MELNVLLVSLLPMDEELFSALQHLKHRNHEVIIFHTIDKAKEVDLNYGNSPYTFVDMETDNNIVKAVDPRTIKYIIVNDVKYVLKTLKLDNQDIAKLT